MRKTSFKCRWN